MNKNRERPHSLEQIAEWLGWFLAPATFDPDSSPVWTDGEKTICAGNELPDFFDPQHNWRVRDAVKAMLLKISPDFSVTHYMVDAKHSAVSIHREAFSPNNTLVACEDTEELAWIEALAELKRLEKEGK